MITKERVAFVRLIKMFYKLHKRDFSWRQTTDPYEILVSEVMLQQTQTARVAEKYNPFLRQFPNVQALACAPFAQVLLLWKGLGYNRRALALQRCAQTVVDEYAGIFPKNPEELRQLPGIGPYTSCAVTTFAFNIPNVFIETNIRSVFIHTFFRECEIVNDRDILPLIEQTLDKNNPREWYYALMDYGAELKKSTPNPNRRSSVYAKQSRFEGSNRQVRGIILQTLLDVGRGLMLPELVLRIEKHDEIVKKALLQLIRDELVVCDNGYFALRAK